MMRILSIKFAILLICINSFINIVNAQEKIYDIKRKFNADTTTKLETVKLKLTKVEDDKLIKVEFTNPDGTFIFEKIPNGKYILTSESIYFEPYTSAIITLDRDIDLGSIRIGLLSINLKEVTITSNKPFIKQEYDKTVINVSSTLTTAGKNALEILPDLDSHNEQIEKALHYLVSKRESFTIIGKGRTQDEKSIVYVENGHFYGMGYLSSDTIINEITELKEHVTRYASNQYIMQLIYSYSEKYSYKVKRMDGVLVGEKKTLNFRN